MAALPKATAPAVRRQAAPAGRYGCGSGATRVGCSAGASASRGGVCAVWAGSGRAAERPRHGLACRHAGRAPLGAMVVCRARPVAVGSVSTAVRVRCMRESVRTRTELRMRPGVGLYRINIVPINRGSSRASIYMESNRRITPICGRPSVAPRLAAHRWLRSCGITVSVRTARFQIRDLVPVQALQLTVQLLVSLTALPRGLPARRHVLTPDRPTPLFTEPAPLLLKVMAALADPRPELKALVDVGSAGKLDRSQVSWHPSSRLWANGSSGRRRRCRPVNKISTVPRVYSCTSL